MPRGSLKQRESPKEKLRERERESRSVRGGFAPRPGSGSALRARRMEASRRWQLACVARVHCAHSPQKERICILHFTREAASTHALCRILCLLSACMGGPALPAAPADAKTPSAQPCRPNRRSELCPGATTDFVLLLRLFWVPLEHNDLSRSSPLGTAAKATAVPGSLQRPLCRTHVVHRRSGCRCTPSQTPRRANMAVRGISFTGSEWPRSLSRWKDPTGRPLRPQLSELHPLSGELTNTGRRLHVSPSQDFHVKPSQGAARPSPISVFSMVFCSSMVGAWVELQ